MFYNFRKNKKAFTLVELIVVIAIIAILGAVVGVTVSVFLNNAKETAAENPIKGLNEQWENMLTLGKIKNTSTMFAIIKELYPKDYQSFSASANIWKTALKDISNDATIYFHDDNCGNYYGQIKLIKKFGGIQVIKDSDGKELWTTETAPTGTTACPAS